MAEGGQPAGGAGVFRLLLDANAFIALEPTSTAPESGLAIGAELLRLAGEGGHKLYLQDAIHRDFERDHETARRDVHRLLSRKYQMLGALRPSDELLERAGHATRPDPASNDGVDLEFLATLDSGAVDYLVTDDQGLKRRAIRAGVGEFVVSLAEAVALLRNLRPADATEPPAVEALKAFQLDASDPIFRSIAADYPGFDNWLRKVRSEHRPAWIVRTAPEAPYAAIMLVKNEESGEYELPGRVLKVSTFKVSDEALGRKYGELLLKALFGYAHNQSIDTVYLTVFDRHGALIDLLEAFGFEAAASRTPLGEVVMIKRRRPADLSNTDWLDTHRRHGPPFIDPRSPVFIVPIRPTWHELLFPDYESGLPIWTGEHPYGNALRKAYICGSPSRLVRSGATVLFYRSQDLGGVTVAGVVDDVLVSQSPEAVTRFVGRRTVYTVPEIEAMARRHHELHAMLFRQDRLIQPAWRLRELERAGVLRAWPQSITKLGEEGTRWVHQQLAGSQ